jgi:hypothetical protein
MKIPDPIIDPMTSAVELNRPRVGTNRGASVGTADSRIGVIFGVVTYSKFYCISGVGVS